MNKGQRDTVDKQVYQRLSSTQRLPAFEKPEKTSPTFRCRCMRLWRVPERNGHFRCPCCGAIHTIGIPPQYVRIACSCGKILTALKKDAGKEGRCPGCKRVHKIGSPYGEKKQKEGANTLLLSQEPLGNGFSATVHFRCPCGQFHLAQETQTTIRCFRCGRETAVPILPLSSPGDSPDNSWIIETAYPGESPFDLLQVSPETSLAEIKKAYVKMHSRISRHDPLFQKIQWAKDTLTKPERRLFYEIMSSPLRDWWKGLTKEKWLKLHDDACARHQAAIEEEKKRGYHKADRLWQKSVQAWLQIAQSDPFWEAARQRGENLFAPKFKPEIVVRLRNVFLEDTIVKVGCQFRDKYLAEQNCIRAQSVVRGMLPVLLHQMGVNPADVRLQNLLRKYCMDEVKMGAQQGAWRKAADALSLLLELFPGETQSTQFANEIFSVMRPLLPFSIRTRLTKRFESFQEIF